MFDDVGKELVLGYSLPDVIGGEVSDAVVLVKTLVKVLVFHPLVHVMEDESVLVVSHSVVDVDVGVESDDAVSVERTGGAYPLELELEDACV